VLDSREIGRRLHLVTIHPAGSIGGKFVVGQESVSDKYIPERGSAIQKNWADDENGDLS
jgi:hypothetical protein